MRFCTIAASGMRNYVVDPTSVQVDHPALQAKTDSIDVALLLRSMMAYLRRETEGYGVARGQENMSNPENYFEMIKCAASDLILTH